MTSDGDETPLQRVDTRPCQRGHSTQGFHGNPPAPWADALSEDRQSWPPVLQHCWYDGPYGRQAALLIEWRCIAGGYDGRIVVPAREPDGWAVVEMWVESGMLSPV